jgi:hypothetical protein
MSSIRTSVSPCSTSSATFTPNAPPTRRLAFFPAIPLRGAQSASPPSRFRPHLLLAPRSPPAPQQPTFVDRADLVRARWLPRSIQANVQGMSFECLRYCQPSGITRFSALVIRKVWVYKLFGCNVSTLLKLFVILRPVVYCVVSSIAVWVSPKPSSVAALL